MAFAVGLHQGALRGAITRYKYRGARNLAGAFAATLAGYLAAHPTWFEEFDLITAVPSYLGLGARRSWDPVGDILAALPERLARTGEGWQVVPGAVLKRRETPGMAGLGWARRQALASGALRDALFVPAPDVVAGRQILVIDDVLTEGSTLREVARALRSAGASDVAGLVLARPPWSSARSPGERPAASAERPAAM